jgi:hypothetical protein
MAQTHSRNDLVLQVHNVSYSGTIKVDVMNASQGRLRIWKDSNSWGAARWRVLVIRSGQLLTFYQNPDQDFTVNLPTFNEIAAGSHFEQDLNLNDGNWRDSESKGNTFVAGDTIVVIYDVPFTPESLKLGVWYGVATTSTIVK